MADTSTPSTVAVATQSAWASKINWTQALAMLAMVLAYFGISLPPDVQSAILAGIVGVSTVATWIMRTWFTKTVTPASVANASTTTTLAVPVAHIT